MAAPNGTGNGKKLAGMNWLVQPLIGAVAGGGAGYAVLQAKLELHEKGIIQLRQEINAHHALIGHPGELERIEALQREMDKHEQADTALYTNGLGGRIDELEQRILD